MSNSYTIYDSKGNPVVTHEGEKVTLHGLAEAVKQSVRREAEAPSYPVLQRETAGDDRPE